MSARIEPFFDPDTGTFSYVVADPETGAAAVIDPLLGFDQASGRTDSSSLDSIVEFLTANAYSLEWILETHAHADHLTGAQLLKSKLGGVIAIGEGIRKVQAHFGPVFNLGPPFAADGHQFDHLFEDGETFNVGKLQFRVMHTPGHTSDSVTYIVGKAAFIGDTLFMTDIGSARCDFPGGDAGLLYDSIQKLLALPADTVFYLCHDYPSGRDATCASPLVEQRDNNVHVGGGTSREDYVAMRGERDATLAMPQLIIPSIQVNIQGGHLPAADDNGIAYIRVPIDTL